MSYMNFRNFQLKYFLINMLVLLMYPFYRYLANNNSILAFSDACTIIGLILAIIGIVYMLLLYGDFDITMYIAGRLSHREESDFENFRENNKQKRKDSFNYPLLCSVVLLIIGWLSAQLI